MCAAAALIILSGSFALPVSVRADDDDDDDYLEDLVDLTPEEERDLEMLLDMDDDNDVDETDVDAVRAEKIAEDMRREAAERERAYEDELRRQQEAEKERQRQMDLELERQRQAASEAQRQAAEAQRQAEYDRQRSLELEAKLKQDHIKALEAEAKYRAEKEKEKEKRVTGIAVSSTDVVLTPGQTYQIIAYVKPDNARNKRAYFSSTNPSVASIDQSGVIRGNDVGSCVVTATSEEGGYSVCTTVRVNPGQIMAAQTISQDANWTAIAANMIIAALPGQTVNLVAPKAMSFDAGMMNALKARPDVSLLIAYPYNGHTYLMAVPAGYNLAAKADNTGKVSFIKLAAVKDGKIITTMVK